MDVAPMSVWMMKLKIFVTRSATRMVAPEDGEKPTMMMLLLRVGFFFCSLLYFLVVTSDPF